MHYGPAHNKNTNHKAKTQNLEATTIVHEKFILFIACLHNNKLHRSKIPTQLAIAQHKKNSLMV